MTPEQLETAKTMRAAGATYRAIGEALGVNRTTAQYWLNPARREYGRKPERREKQRKYRHEKSLEYQQEIAKREKQRNHSREAYHLRTSTLEGRCEECLKGSQYRTKKHGYVACNATVEQLVEAFTGYCAICGVAESDLPKRLAMDHCHSTGDFRGWLCQNCNHCLGKLRDDVGAVLSYLDPYNAERLLHARIGDFHAR